MKTTAIHTESSEQNSEEYNNSDHRSSDDEAPYNSDSELSNQEDWLGKRKKEQRYPRYYSFAFYRLTDTKTRVGSTAKAQLSIQKQTVKP